MSHALQNPTEKPINQAILEHTSNEVKSEQIEVICFITLRMPKCKLVGMAQEKILTKKIKIPTPANLFDQLNWCKHNPDEYSMLPWEGAASTPGNP